MKSLLLTPPQAGTYAMMMSFCLFVRLSPIFLNVVGTRFFLMHQIINNFQFTNASKQANKQTTSIVNTMSRDLELVDWH